MEQPKEFELQIQRPPAFQTAGAEPLFGLIERLADFFHFTGAYATRAYIHAHVGAVRSHSLDALDVRF